MRKNSNPGSVFLLTFVTIVLIVLVFQIFVRSTWSGVHLPNGLTFFLYPSIPTITLTATDPSASEPGTDTGAIRITRTGSTNSALSVDVTITGTASNGVDYVIILTPISIPVGAAFVNKILTPIDDIIPEGTESATFKVAPSSNYAIGSPNLGTINITDNEVLGTVNIIPTADPAIEGSSTNGNYKIARTGSTAAALTVNLAVTGTATNGVDYTLIPTAKIIPAGSSFINVPLTLINETIIEPTETAIVTIAPGAYTIGGPAQATIGILDDDGSRQKGWWKFNEGIGTTALDSSASIPPSPGVISNGTWKTVAFCESGNCLEFNGINSRVNVGNNPFLNPGRITLSAWVYPTAPQGTIGQMIVGKLKQGGGGSYWLEIAGGILSGKLHFVARGSDVFSDSPLPANQWSHVAAVFDGPSNGRIAARIYVNGVETGTPVFKNGILPQDSDTTVIGNSNTTSQSGGPFKGRIDEVLIYDRGLTPAQIASIAAGGTPPF